MARNQKNFRFFTYVDDDGVSWNLRGEDGGAAAGIDGHAAEVSSQPTWNRSKRNHPRIAVYQDPTTGRTAHPIFYTATAFAAATPGSTINVQVEGLATTVAYTLVQKIGEKKRRVPARTNQLPDS